MEWLWKTDENLSMYITRDVINYVIMVYNISVEVSIGFYDLYNQKPTKLISERNTIIPILKNLDISDKNSWSKAIDLVIWSLLKFWVNTSLIVSLREDYEAIHNFLESSDIKSFIFGNKKEVWTVLSWEKFDSSVLETVSKRISLLLNLYITSWKSLQRVKLEYAEIRTIKEHLELQIKELKGELKQLKKSQVENQKTINVKTSTIDRLNREKDWLDKKMILLESEKKLLWEQLNNQDVNNNIKPKDWDLEDALELALEYQAVAENTQQQLDKVNKENASLSIQLNNIQSTLVSSNNVNLFTSNCEQFPNGCSIKDMLKYITIKDIPLPFKKEIVDIIIDFLDEFLLNVSKGASSGMNWNIWVGWWTYANNYINPLVNYIKEKWRNWGGTQSFLEFISNIDLKSLTKDIVDPNYGNKKSRFFLSVYEQLDDNNFMNIFEALGHISKKLENIKRWNLDLSTLSKNIDNFLNNKKDVLERKFREVFLKVINQK